MPRVWEGARHCCRLQERREEERLVDYKYLIRGIRLRIGMSREQVLRYQVDAEIRKMLRCSFSTVPQVS